MNVPFVDLIQQYHSLKPEIEAAVADVLESSSYILGKYVSRFESEIRDYLQVKHAIGVNSGTDALVLSLVAAGIGPGDEVITAANSFFATAGAICLAGARPIFVDVDERTYNMDPQKLYDCLKIRNSKSQIRNRTKAIIPVHLYGQPADMDEILQLARAHDLIVIEDACQAMGAAYNGRRVGTFGLTGCFSFVPAKNLGGFGDGGIITTNDDAFAERVRVLRDHGSSQKYFHKRVGYNSRLDAIQAAVLSVKLRYLDQWNDARDRAASRYNFLLGDLDVVTPTTAPDRRHVWHLYVIRTKYRDALQSYLREKGIQTLVHYPIPIHRQEAFQNEAYPALPVTEKVAKEIISLPMWPHITNEQIERTVDAIRAFYRSNTN